MRSRSPLAALVLAFALTFGPGCAIGNLLTGPPAPVQIVQAAADTVDAANALGEVVKALSKAAIDLHTAHALSNDIDRAVQVAAIQFANDKDKAVIAMNQAVTVGQLVSAGAPLVGSATAIKTAFSSANLTGLGGTAAVYASSIPSLLAQADKAVKTLVNGK